MSTDLRSCTRSIRSCGRRLQWQKALKLLKNHRGRVDCISYTTAMTSCSWILALSLNQEMGRKLLSPDSVTYGVLLSSLSSWFGALRLLCDMAGDHIELNLVTSNASSKSLPWRHAQKRLSDLRAVTLEPDVVALNTLLNSQKPERWHLACVPLYTMYIYYRNN